MTKPRSSNRRNTTARYPRTARINEVLREVIATELERDVDDDPRLELVTITGVDTDADLARARVYFSALDTTATTEEVIAALNERRVAWQAVIGKNVRMKRTPQLVFEADSAITEGQRIEEILRGMRSGD